VATANLFFLPIGTKLKKMSEEELRVRQLTIDVLVNIQEGAKPEYIRERLRVSLPPEVRRTIAALSRRAKNKAKGTTPLPEEEFLQATGV
jgi:chemotaxis protein MotA